MQINILTKEDDVIKEIFRKIEQIKNQIKIIKRNNHSLFKERYITDTALSIKLSVSKRTLQVWRNNGLIGYIKIEGKLIYRESDIEKLLKNNYHSPF